MANNIPIITSDTALIWAASEMTKAWISTAKGPAPAPEQIANAFQTIYTNIIKITNADKEVSFPTGRSVRHP